MAPQSAPAPDGLTVRKLRRVPPEVLTLIANNFLTHHHLPEDLQVPMRSFARLQRLGSPIVEAVLEGALDGFRQRLKEKVRVSSRIVEATSFNAALRDARQIHLEEGKQKYTNKSLFAFESDPLGNWWLWPDARYMSDGDRIKSLRLRSNLFPTRTLSNRHSNDESARLCRRCHKAPETTYHILQVCQAVHEPRCSRHNFIAKSIANFNRVTPMLAFQPTASLWPATVPGSDLISSSTSRKKHSSWMWR
ncbi:hypothetical protein MTO96_050323 [Rhipicephalus appendiculatus]